MFSLLIFPCLICSGFIRRAQLLWEKRILKSLNTMCTELSVPLARKRGKQEQIELKTKWNEIGAGNPNLEQYRLIVNCEKKNNKFQVRI